MTDSVNVLFFVYILSTTWYGIYDMLYLAYLCGGAQDEEGLSRTKQSTHDPPKSVKAPDQESTPRVTHGPQRTRVTHGAEHAQKERAAALSAVCRSCPLLLSLQ